MLFLLESPGPMARPDDTVGHGSNPSGLISVDNDDPTAEALWHFRSQARLLTDCVHWNAIPWYIPGGKITSADERQALPLLGELLAMLPRLEAVVPMGRVAQRVWTRYSLATATRYVTLPTWHPAARSLNQPGARDHVAMTCKRSAALLAI
ncbi:uracil-DNA glycosylase [Flexivirga sp. ID2601S]|uniref:Uracil-DNA glycosylase n=1 Tax=Flexivirga aerilata TaxID=1656889 RepID=A0A849ALT0_9MICO|nr:uracil-DNA glycosylase [Flexivirga aerilata]NNG37762.1 uracil-DNA glycosylase [Flexivirga aerilata]